MKVIATIVSLLIISVLVSQTAQAQTIIDTKNSFINNCINDGLTKAQCNDVWQCHFVDKLPTSDCIDAAMKKTSLFSKFKDGCTNDGFTSKQCDLIWSCAVEEHNPIRECEDRANKK